MENRAPTVTIALHNQWTGNEDILIQSIYEVWRRVSECAVTLHLMEPYELNECRCIPTTKPAYLNVKRKLVQSLATIWGTKPGPPIPGTYETFWFKYPGSMWWGLALRVQTAVGPSNSSDRAYEEDLGIVFEAGLAAPALVACPKNVAPINISVAELTEIAQFIGLRRGILFPRGNTNPPPPMGSFAAGRHPNWGQTAHPMPPRATENDDHQKKRKIDDDTQAKDSPDGKAKGGGSRQDTSTTKPGARSTTDSGVPTGKHTNKDHKSTSK